MEIPATKLRIGEWRVDPALGQISRDGESTRLEARTMRLLLCLAEHAGQVVSIDDLLNEVWSGVIVSPDSVYQAVTSLRRVLGDDPKQPSYIATVPRLGYRMVARVEPWVEGTETPPETSISHEKKESRNSGTPSARRSIFSWPIGVALLGGLALVAILVLLSRDRGRNTPTVSPLAAQPQRSIAVLPFLDLTEGMKAEEFADGMTEELIDKLSKIPGLRVPTATSSFYFKGKQIPVAEIAKSLGVAYVLDGSVRKSGVWLRVDARLVRADSGYVVWSETYDQPLHNILMVQDDIASAVAKALKDSIGDQPVRNSKP
jgi:transcriptional activator of cad operon